MTHIFTLDYRDVSHIKGGGGSDTFETILKVKGTQLNKELQL